MTLLLFALIGLLAAVAWRANPSFAQIVDALDTEITLGRPNFPVTVPWLNRPDLAHYDLRYGRDSVHYQPETRNREGLLLQANVDYDRYSVIARGARLPGLKAAQAQASRPQRAVLGALASFDTFPSPDGLGVAFVAQLQPASADISLIFQLLVDGAFARLVDERELVLWMSEVARTEGPRGATHARLLIEHYPKIAEADGLPRRWASARRYPETALVASLALYEEDPGPLTRLALGRGPREIPDEIARAAWDRLMEAPGAQARLVKGLTSASARVFFDAGRRLIKEGRASAEGHITEAADTHAKPTHTSAAARLLARLPSSKADRDLVRWLIASPEARGACAEALAARESLAASPTLVSWLKKGPSELRDFALTWLERLGAPEAVGAIRAFKRRALPDALTSRLCDGAIAGILARTTAGDGALALIEEGQGQVSLADEALGAVSEPESE